MRAPKWSEGFLGGLGVEGLRGLGGLKGLGKDLAEDLGSRV